MLAVMGIHWLDGFRWMLADEPVSLICTLASSPLIRVHGETEAVLHARFVGGASVSYVQSFSCLDASLQTNIVGEAGALRLAHSEVHEWQARPGDDHEKASSTNELVHPNPTGLDKPGATFLALDQFLQALESGTEATNSGRDNLRTMAFLEAAYASAELGGTVGLEPETSQLAR